MPLAVITGRQIIELLILIVVVHAVLLAPLVVAIIGAFSERIQNQQYEPRV
jgi:hypothetical protein